MEEIILKLDIPPAFKEEVKLALTKALRDFEIELKFAVADKILSKSKLTEKQIKEMLGR